MLIAACAKHFAGYGDSESGRDYNTTNIPENELRNVHLHLHAMVEAGVASVMTSFSDLDGIPATASEFLLKRVLRGEWDFDGVVVSDWESIRQLAVHGFTGNERDSALEAANAGVDIEMASTTYQRHLASLVDEGRRPRAARRDGPQRAAAQAATRALQASITPMPPPSPRPATRRICRPRATQRAGERGAAQERARHAPALAREHLDRIAVIGPLADDAHEQLGTWIFDGDPHLSQPLLPRSARAPATA